MRACAFLVGLVAFASAETWFKETFDDGWEDRWIKSKHKSDYGEWKVTAGKFYGDADADKGLQTSQDAKFYAIAAKFDKDHTNEGKTLVVQFSVKHEQNIDCGGGYVKVMPHDADLEDFHGDTQYGIMFGPDICGPGTKKVHVIFGHNGKNLLTKKDIRCKDDEYTHVYTLIVKSDNTYEVLIDNEKAESGELEADWDFLPPKKIKDPEAKKPDDWVDNEMMDDPEDSKPEDWDKPEHIPDPEAKKPEDWDDDMDGEWEPPQIDNPEYKGEWKPRQIKNPDYKGPWIHPEIDNPEYKEGEGDSLYKIDSVGAIGFDLWQVKSGTIFDNVYVGDSVEEAKALAEETWAKNKDAEKKMKEEQDEVERKKMEEEEKARKEKEDAEKKDDDEEEEDAEDADDAEDKKDEKDEL